MRGHSSKVVTNVEKVTVGYVHLRGGYVESPHEFAELQDLHKPQHDPAHDQAHLEAALGLLFRRDLNSGIDPLFIW